MKIFKLLPRIYANVIVRLLQFVTVWVCVRNVVIYLRTHLALLGSNKEAVAVKGGEEEKIYVLLQWLYDEDDEDADSYDDDDDDDGAF